MEQKIAILILFFNRLDETVKCIESFIPSQQPIYVLNNGSDAALWNALQDQYKNNLQVTLFHSEINLGVSKGRNYLINNTKEPWLLIVDNDITVKEPLHWYHQFQDILMNHPSLEVCTLHIYNLHENAYVKPIKVVKEKNKVSIETTDSLITNCFPGTGSIVHRNVFIRHGLFDETLFVGFEDYEYALRCMISSHGELTVLHSDAIDLIHDHKFQKKIADKNAVMERYNEQRIKESYDSIVQKYQIEFEHDFEWWSKKQITSMTVPLWKQKMNSIITNLFHR